MNHTKIKILIGWFDNQTIEWHHEQWIIEIDGSYALIIDYFRVDFIEFRLYLKFKIIMAKSNGTEARVQVAVRARPLNQREVENFALLNHMNLINLFFL